MKSDMYKADFDSYGGDLGAALDEKKTRLKNR